MTFTFKAPPGDKSALETGPDFTPKFDEKGLVTAVVTDAGDGQLLMVAHMNEEALALTLESGVAHYFSRSRNRIWKKGETSGNLQMVKEIRTDCDQDAVWLKVTVGGHDATCHTGRRSCFYRTVSLVDGAPVVAITDEHRHFDPDEIYSGSNKA
ncbi:phosphoribosyl-AMP cyclohydrolase [Rhizobiaceae bacterium n13]|uniref:Phosphoribosyl-AMP cyclohydrolase n=1 Tax=Ferirhizobium litorale TaxID=2927786 RepID=A0AAE3QJX4_9HYPH|nr:phosphoribosyl-AMP cyclohydrolase [Fererhizobium litorale]MDI7864049.1 phosphoribosyl-AMP cyclohydrolase [Fererhizobium litorale]MDI7924468.1 phosphoribosyl-AMP cyclohydrolase [Fererhizobium litorale]